MGKKLVIVESPAKSKTIGRYLGPDFQITASLGHIRDLPSGNLGVDVKNDFKPIYITMKGKEKVVRELKTLAAGCDEVLLATDPDREGEAIAWHLAEVLGVDLSVLQSLNPQYRKDIIPGNGTPYSLWLPQGHVDGFITLKDSILKHKADSFNVNRVVVIPAQGDPYYRAGKGAIGKGVYVVKKGDTLSGIAKRRKVSVATIKKWNNLKSDRIYIGQRLKMK